MRKIVHKFLSQENINNFYHLPRAFLANVLYGFPTRKLKVIGITGTDGKTTTTNMIYQILKDAGKKVSMVSTINAPGSHVTSPDPFTIQKFAKQALKNGDEYLVLEVTSHAIDQYRFWGIKFDVGVITNITHEHLDYHKTFENYKKTKLKLKASQLISNQNLNIKGITFGLEKGDFNQKQVKLNLKIPGDYNIENALAAMAVAYSLNISSEVARKSLQGFKGLVGRMEEVKNKKGIKIYIDFAHTPNGLESSLKALRSKASPGRLIAIIGAEGLRDEGKRVMMGEIAQKLANIVIVAPVDPRGFLDAINKQISEGAKKAGAKEGINFFIKDDRQEAIDFAINKLGRRGDTIGIFGKGHETSMNLDGKKEIPWSDKKAVKQVLNG